MTQLILKYLHRLKDHLQEAFKPVSSLTFLVGSNATTHYFPLKTDCDSIIYEAMAISSLVSLSLLSRVHAPKI